VIAGCNQDIGATAQLHKRKIIKEAGSILKRKIGYPVGEIIRNYYKMQPLISAENSVTDEPFVTICRSMQAMSSRKRR